MYADKASGALWKRLWTSQLPQRTGQGDGPRDRTSRLARDRGLGACHPGLSVIMFPLQFILPFHCHPCQYPRPQPVRFLPLPPARLPLGVQLPLIRDGFTWTGHPCRLLGLRGGSGGPRLKSLTPSQSPLSLPHSIPLLLLALPASLFRPSCLNRLKPTLCSGFLWSW